MMVQLLDLLRLQPTFVGLLAVSLRDLDNPCRSFVVLLFESR